MRESGSNALASTIVLVCRLRLDDASLSTRREVAEASRGELPAALKALQHGSIAPVDFAQAASGLAWRFSPAIPRCWKPTARRCGCARRSGSSIGRSMKSSRSRKANTMVETRWLLAWFEQNGMNEGKFGDVDTLSRAKDAAVNALQEAGIVNAGAGKVRLVSCDALSPEWDPAAEPRLTVWELTQHLIRALEVGGDASTARIIRRAGGLAETAKDLAYRLYTICDRKGWSQEALAYNMLVKS
jgi:putative DNA methylase